LNSSFDWANMLGTVWKNGQLIKDQTFDQVRSRANLPALD